MTKTRMPHTFQTQTLHTDAMHYQIHSQGLANPRTIALHATYILRDDAILRGPTTHEAAVGLDPGA